MFKHQIDVVALAADVPDCLAEFADLAKRVLLLRRVHGRHLSPAFEITPIDHVHGTQPHDKVALVLIVDDANRIARPC